ncbi:reverse transcriptase [Gossypium australe]|uniref:Reverse transcriptase n=1 Tax=Gossypium australe TaxID=47621 RepID=A0A5B6X5R3_9ROSI|nr:reverse transcriptase [Gossypium australe]
MHWCTWKSLSVRKEECGMSFHDLNFFNIALLAKQGWRLLRNPNLLLVQFVGGKGPPFKMPGLEDWRWTEERDAERILCILLSRSPHADFVIWREEPTGEYSVQKTREHLFRDCPVAKETWERLDIVGPVSEENIEFTEWAKYKQGLKIADFVTNYLMELNGVKQILPDRRIHTNRWVAPLGMSLRINFDAAFNRQRNESCSGFVIRNGKAEVMCSKTIIIRIYRLLLQPRR